MGADRSIFIGQVLCEQIRTPDIAFQAQAQVEFGRRVRRCRTANGIRSLISILYAAIHESLHGREHRPSPRSGNECRRLRDVRNLVTVIDVDAFYCLGEFGVRITAAKAQLEIVQRQECECNFHALRLCRAGIDERVYGLADQYRNLKIIPVIVENSHLEGRAAIVETAFGARFIGPEFLGIDTRRNLDTIENRETERDRGLRLPCAKTFRDIAVEHPVLVDAIRNVEPRICAVESFIDNACVVGIDTLNDLQQCRVDYLHEVAIIFEVSQAQGQVELVLQHSPGQVRRTRPRTHCSVSGPG